MRVADWQEALAAHGPFTRVVVAEVKGSAPREPGAELRVWPHRFEGTIGGGQLEFEALARARGLIGRRVERIPLGPAMGQCCGGAVTLCYERITESQVPRAGEMLRAVAMTPETPTPLFVHRAQARARDRGERPALRFGGGWLLEPVDPPKQPLWIWGAGHVGRALVNVLEPLGTLAITWVDTDARRFPEASQGPARLIAENPADLVPLSPANAQHVIATYSHALDLELCHRLLSQGFAGCGLIGSATKWVRFRNRLRILGHSDAQISRIACPIGDPTLGKAPEAIAIGIAGALLKTLSVQSDRAGTAIPRKGRAG